MTAIEAIRTELDNARRAVTAFEQALAILEGHEPPAPHPALPVPKADAPRPSGTGASATWKLSNVDRILIALIDGPLSSTQIAEKSGLTISQVKPRLPQLRLWVWKTPQGFQLTDDGLTRAKRAARINH